MFISAEDLLNYIKSNAIKFVDFRFTDHCGQWHHITRYAESLTVNSIKEGIAFDSSSIKGWKPVENSDMIIVPDITTTFSDPFFSQATLGIICDVIDAHTNQPYELDPRYTAKKAIQYMQKDDIANKVFFGPEIEFFVFDDVRFDETMNSSFFTLDSLEGPYNSGRKYDYGNNGHRPKLKGGYMPLPPIDSFQDLRSEILLMLAETGLKPLLHHHENAASQCEVGFQCDELLQSADNVQKCKYVIRNVANSYGKTATFMPKPIKNDSGSGMHCNQSLWRDNLNLFAQDNNTLSECALFYIGGLLKHGKALNAFTNQTTNSYKRLTAANCEAPMFLTYSYSNRSAAIRIPKIRGNPCETRIESRFPDPVANPYLCFAAQLMAGLDGIKNKIHPGDAVNINLYALEKKEQSQLNAVSKSLKEALTALELDCEFLLQNGVFTDTQIETHIRVKTAEIEELESSPHPIEFKNYYNS